MQSFIVSARKYRPQRFTDVLGQAHVTTTLCNALTQGKLAQVFLFCGPKGTGKTTTARLLAQAVNCEALTKGGEPCHACGGCTRFLKQTGVHVHELDAASHNSVDDIRHLTEQVRYHAPHGKRVFIIDEAHMLSNAAFNALLKTLEDTPPHVLFIFATTERHKIIAPVQSRCQIFDFHPVGVEKMVAHLTEIADKEGVTCASQALTLIARKAEGALRDALSMFDLVVTFEGGKKLTVEGVQRHLHVLAQDYYATLVGVLYQGEGGKALEHYDQVVGLGFDGLPFLTGLSEHLRYLLLCQVAPKVALQGVEKKDLQAYRKQAEVVPAAFVYAALKLMDGCAMTYKESPHKRLHLELALLEVAHMGNASLAKGEKETLPAPTPRPAAQRATPPSAPPMAAPAVEVPSPTQVTAPAPPTPRPAAQRVASSGGEVKRPLSTTAIPKSLEEVQAQVAKAQQEAAEKGVPAMVATPSDHPMPKQEAVQKYWQRFLQSLGTQAPPMTTHVLKQPYALAGTTITVTLTNAVEKEELQRLAPALLEYLRLRVQDSRLALTVDLQPAKATYHPYTDQEKWTYLCKEHPQLVALQQALALETS